MDFATLVITLFSQHYFYFGAGKLNWTGTIHHALHIDCDIRKPVSLQQLISLNSSYANIADARSHIRSTLNRLEDGRHLHIDRSLLSANLVAHIATGDLTLETFLQLIGKTNALAITNPANNEYDATYRVDISCGMPRFFDTVADLIRILRSPFPGQKNASFVVRFHPLNSKVVGTTRVAGYQPDPGVLKVSGGAIVKTSPRALSTGNKTKASLHVPAGSKAVKPAQAISTAKHLDNPVARVSTPARAQRLKGTPKPNNPAARKSTEPSPSRSTAIYVDRLRKDIRVNDRWCSLTDAEFTLFCILEQYAGQTCSYEQLNDALGLDLQKAGDSHPDDRAERSMRTSVGSRVGTLRRKLIVRMGKSPISSVAGCGYRYDGPPVSTCNHVSSAALPAKEDTDCRQAPKVKPEAAFASHRNVPTELTQRNSAAGRGTFPSTASKSDKRIVQRYISKSQGHELVWGATRKDTLVDGTPLPLSGIHFAIMQYLIQHAGQTIPARQLYTAGYGMRALRYEDIIERDLSQIRDKLHDSGPEPEWIRHIPNQGFQFIGALVSTRSHTQTEPTPPKPPSIKPVQPAATRPSESSKRAFSAPSQEPGTAGSQVVREKAFKRSAANAQAIPGFLDIEIFADRHDVTVSGRRLHLAPEYYLLLLRLLSQRDAIVTNEWIQQLCAAAHADQAQHPTPKKCIGLLRLKLGDNPSHPRYIAAVPDEGYRFIGRINEDVAAQAQSSLAALRAATLQQSDPSRDKDNAVSEQSDKPIDAFDEIENKLPSASRHVLHFLLDHENEMVGRIAILQYVEEQERCEFRLQDIDKAISALDDALCASGDNPGKIQFLAGRRYRFRKGADQLGSKSAPSSIASQEADTGLHTDNGRNLYLQDAHLPSAPTQAQIDGVAPITQEPAHISPSHKQPAVDDEHAPHQSTLKNDGVSRARKPSTAFSQDWYSKDEFFLLAGERESSLSPQQRRVLVRSLGFREYDDCILRESAGSRASYYRKILGQSLVPFERVPELLRTTPSFTNFIDNEHHFGRLFLYDDDTWITGQGLRELGIAARDIGFFVYEVFKCLTANHLACVTVPWLKQFASDMALIKYGLSDRFYESVLDSRESVCRGKLCGTALFGRYKHNVRGNRLITSLVETEGSTQLNDLLDELNEDFGIPITRQRLIPLIHSTTLYFSPEVDRVYANHAQFIREVE